MKKLLKILGILVLALVVLAAGFVAYLSIEEYRPAEQEEVVVTQPSQQTDLGETVTILTWNTGYAGLGDNADFFMDGGTSVKSSGEDRVGQNLADIQSFLSENPTDFVFLQEVDTDSGRSYHHDQRQYYEAALGCSGAFALNYSCPFVPFPLPPIGAVHSGILTLTGNQITGAARISLPCPFSWPVSTANLKRCLLVTRTPLQNGKELVLVNLHLEAYDDGAGKAAQTEMLLSVLQEEYEKGNYVIAGGDFNQTFPGSLEQYPIRNAENWTPGVLEEESLPEGWSYAYDTAAPTCRLLDAPYDETMTQQYVIDGFILSPNVETVGVETQNLGFHSSDHNPVRLEVSLISAD